MADVISKIKANDTTYNIKDARVDSTLVIKTIEQTLSDTEKNQAKINIGLGNVDNTRDVDKPISSATQTALNAKQESLVFNTAYSATTNKVATMTDITNAIGAAIESSY